MISTRANKKLTPALVLAALVLFFLATISFITPARAQKLKQLPPPTPAPRYKPKTNPEPEYEVVRDTSNLVMVPVSVVNAVGQTELSLKQRDSHVEEDRRTQEHAQLGAP